MKISSYTPHNAIPSLVLPLTSFCYQKLIVVIVLYILWFSTAKAISWANWVCAISATINSCKLWQQRHIDTQTLKVLKMNVEGLPFEHQRFVDISQRFIYKHQRFIDKCWAFVTKHWRLLATVDGCRQAWIIFKCPRRTSHQKCNVQRRFWRQSTTTTVTGGLMENMQNVCHFDNSQFLYTPSCISKRTGCKSCNHGTKALSHCSQTLSLLVLHSTLGPMCEHTATKTTTTSHMGGAQSQHLGSWFQERRPPCALGYQKGHWVPCWFHNLHPVCPGPTFKHSNVPQWAATIIHSIYCRWNL